MGLEGLGGLDKLYIRWTLPSRNNTFYVFDEHDSNNTERKHSWLEHHQWYQMMLDWMRQERHFWSTVTTINIYASGPGLSMEMHQLRGEKRGEGMVERGLWFCLLPTAPLKV